MHATGAWPVMLLCGLAVVAGGCSFESTFDDTHFQCEGSGPCPSGQTCVDGQCVPGGGGQVDSGSPSVNAAIATDASQADANTSVALVECDVQYGAALNYELCSSTGDSCTFWVKTAGGVCTALCESLGGTCLDGFDAAAAAHCTPTAHQGCNSTHTTQMCVCSREPPP